MISLQNLLIEKKSIIPDEDVKERSWIIVFRHNSDLEVLLVQDEDKKWSLPGGQLDNEETAEDAAWRELKEETGIVPEKLDFLKTIYHDKPNKLKVSHVFYTEIGKDIKVKSKDDAERSRWFSLDKLPAMDDLSKPKQESIKLASEKIHNPKKEIKEAMDLARTLGLRLPVEILTEGKKKKTSNGYLIVFEGIDGSGKTTQKKNLKNWLEEKKWKVVTSNWGTSPYISEVIKSGKAQKWLTPALYSLLHASDMIWRYENEIKPALDKGAVVLCDRYYYTSYVRDQLRGVNKNLLENIYENFVEPDLVVHFKVSPRLAVERLLKDKGFKYYSSGMDIGYHENMEECALLYETNMDKAYDDVLTKSKNYRKVNSERSIDEIFREIKKFIYEKIKAEKRVPVIENKMISFTKVMKKILSERMSFRDLLAKSDPARVDRSKFVNARSLRVESMDGDEAWTFRYKSRGNHSTTGLPWHGYVRFFKDTATNKKSADELDCMVDCDCPDYKYRWAYNNAKANAGLVGRKSWNKNNGRSPRPYNDLGEGMCKHLIALGDFLKTKIDPDSPEDVPDDSKAPDPDNPDDMKSPNGELQENMAGLIAQRLDEFAKANPQFDVWYEENTN